MSDERKVEIRVRSMAAVKAIRDLCNGKRKWTMSIPVQEDSDQDVVISKALDDIPDLLDALQAAETALATERERLKQAHKLYELTLNNEIRWMRLHENLEKQVAYLCDWKSPDGVLQVRDLKWFSAIAARKEGE